MSTGGDLSSRYLKRVMYISECNGRISELRGKGYDIETSEQEDEHGFAYHRLVREPAAKQLTPA
ncbi:MAG: helix-turn-helix domain-containing protein [Steroidobacteraceae bacterium]